MAKVSDKETNQLTGYSNLRKERITDAVKTKVSELFKHKRFEDTKTLNEAVESIRKMIWRENHQNKNYPLLATYFNTPEEMIKNVPNLSAEEKIHTKLQMMKALHSALIQSAKHLGYNYESRLWDSVKYTRKISGELTVDKKQHTASQPLARRPAETPKIAPASPLPSHPIVIRRKSQKVPEVSQVLMAQPSTSNKKEEKQSTISSIVTSPQVAAPKNNDLTTVLCIKPITIRGGKKSIVVLVPPEKKSTLPSDSADVMLREDSGILLAPSPLPPPPSPPPSPPIRQPEVPHAKVEKEFQEPQKPLSTPDTPVSTAPTFHKRSDALLANCPELQAQEQQRRQAHEERAAQNLDYSIAKNKAEIARIQKEAEAKKAAREAAEKTPEKEAERKAEHARKIQEKLFRISGGLVGTPTRTDKGLEQSLSTDETNTLLDAANTQKLFLALPFSQEL